MTEREALIARGALKPRPTRPHDDPTPQTWVEQPTCALLGNEAERAAHQRLVERGGYEQ